MGLIKEPIGVDFIVDSRPLTEDEKLAISVFIRTDKEKRRHRELQKRTKPKKQKHHSLLERLRTANTSVSDNRRN